MAEAYLDRVSGKALGELLMEHGHISAQDCEEALVFARQEGIRLGEALVRLGRISADVLSLALGAQFGVRPVELHPSMIDFELVRRFPKALLQEHLMFPLIELGGELVVLVADPHNGDGLRQLAGLAPSSRITAQLAREAHIRACLDSLPGDQRPAPTITLAPTEASPELPGAGASEESFVRWLVTSAIQHPDSDLLITADGAKASVLRQFSPDESLVTLHEFHPALVPSVRESLMQQCEEVSFTEGQVAVWRSPLRFAGRTMTLQLTHVRSTSNFILRLRPLVQFAPEAPAAGQEENETAPTPAMLTVVAYEAREQLNDFLAAFLTAHARSGRTCLYLQEEGRTVYPQAVCLPAPFTSIASALAGTGAGLVVTDSVAAAGQLAAVREMGLRTPVVICSSVSTTSQGERCLSERTRMLLRDFDPECFLLQPDAVHRISSQAALECFGGVN